jgi:hypothetical protein
MFNVTLRQKEGQDWVTVPLPDKLTDRILLLSSMAGKDMVIKIENSLCNKYLCGTQELIDAIKKKYPEALVMDTESAYNLLEYQPELFFVSVETFFGPKDVERVFPEKPKIDPKEGWDHLKYGAVDITKEIAAAQNA